MALPHLLTASLLALSSQGVTYSPLEMHHIEDLFVKLNDVFSARGVYRAAVIRLNFHDCVEFIVRRVP